MAEVIFGNRDISVSIKSEYTSPNANLLNKFLIATVEDDIPITKIVGATASEFKQWVEDEGYIAPKLVAAYAAAVSQVDEAGNPITPEYIWIIGVTEADPDTSIDSLTAAIDMVAALPITDFYGLCPAFNADTWHTYIATAAVEKGMIGIHYDYSGEMLHLPDLTASGTDRTIAIGTLEVEEDGTAADQPAAAWFGEMFGRTTLAGWKYKHLTGITEDVRTDEEVDAAEALGWNLYRIVKGRGETTGSLCTNGTNHIHEVIIRDNIMYMVANELHYLFKNTASVPLDDRGRAMVEASIRKALTNATAKGLIALFGNGSGQFDVRVGEITAEMRSTLEMNDIEFWYVPNYPAEKLVITGKELLAWVNK